MASTKPRIAFPVLPLSAPAHPSRRRRLTHIAAELLVTTGLSSAILFTVLHVFGLADESATSAPFASGNSSSDASTLSVLRVTVVCTLIVYAGVEGGAALLRLLRTRPASEPDDDPTYPYEGMRSLEAGWREPFAIVKAYGSIDS